MTLYPRFMGPLMRVLRWLFFAAPAIKPGFFSPGLSLKYVMHHLQPLIGQVMMATPITAPDRTRQEFIWALWALSTYLIVAAHEFWYRQ
jgi:hypothetical protein